MNRINFIIDGFNLYHSVRQAQRELGGVSTKWLDVRRLCESYLYLFGRDARFERAYYFSALAHHLEAANPDVTNRHRAFMDCLEATGIEVELSRFKRKSIRCRHCGQRFDRYEEKETDVSLAMKLVEVLVEDECDTVVVMTGDTDLAPAARTAQRLFPKKEVAFAFPYGRKNKELKQIAPGSFEISKGQYPKYQLADPFILSSGRSVRKPAGW